jgi:hypothetical protein
VPAETFFEWPEHAANPRNKQQMMTSERRERMAQD